MARTDRLFRLLHALRTLPAPVTAARLADETGVSERTLYRDIDALRAAGAIIDGAAGLGYTMTEDVALPPQSFDRLEIEALVLGLGEVQQQGDPALAAAARSALAKVAASLPERQQRQVLHAVSMVHRYGDRAAPGADHSVIRQACWDERALDIVYRDLGGRVSTRRIHPLAVVYLDHAVMLLAWCCLRTDFRQFRMDRIEAQTLTDHSFRPGRVALLRDYVDRLRSERRQAGATAARSGQDAGSSSSGRK